MTISQVLLLVVGLFTGILCFYELGRRTVRVPGREVGTLGAFEGAIFGLLGLLIAFTFSGAESRFEMRRHLIVEEANAIGAAYLRVDLLPADVQPAMREIFRKYLDARLAFYRNLPDAAAANLEMARATALQGDLWTRSVAAVPQASSPAVVTLVLSSLNEMIDIATARAVALETHPPPIVFILLVVLAFVCAFLAGYQSAGKPRSAIFVFGFAATVAITVFVILDFEYPRTGLIRIEAVDRVLVQVRDTMK